MIRELSTLADASVLDIDVCIVGGGAAGISLALSLADHGVDSIIIESGGSEPDPAVQALYEADNVGISYAPGQNRLRQLGGTTGHWAGFCRPFEPVDLRPRPQVPDSGWPLSIDDFAAYYPGTHDLLQLGPFAYDPEAWLSEIATGSSEPTPVDDPEIVTDVLQFSPPTRFAPTYEQALRASHRIDVLLHANAVAMEVDEGGRVMRSLTVQGLEGPEVRVHARRYVLASGGIENARLLLMLANIERGGLGNDHDNVGRYFADHLGISDAATLIATGATLGLYSGRHTATARRSSVATVPADPTPLEIGFRIRPSDERLDELGIAGLSASFDQAQGDDLPQSAPIVQAFAEQIDQDRGRRADGTGAGPLNLRTVIETAPNRSSRVTLGDGTDTLGLPRARLDWRVTELDRRTMVDGTTAIVRTLGRLGLARGRIRRFDSVSAMAEDSRRVVGNHHMGTTRMTDRAAKGVVDRDCRVHGSANLYVAGSSVFTTSGNSTPTINLVALALRLADHLAGRPYRTPEPAIG